MHVSHLLRRTVRLPVTAEQVQSVGVDDVWQVGVRDTLRWPTIPLGFRHVPDESWVWNWNWTETDGTLSEARCCTSMKQRRLTGRWLACAFREFHSSASATGRMFSLDSRLRQVHRRDNTDRPDPSAHKHARARFQMDRRFKKRLLSPHRAVSCRQEQN